MKWLSLLALGLVLVCVMAHGAAAVDTAEDEDEEDEEFDLPEMHAEDFELWVEEEEDEEDEEEGSTMFRSVSWRFPPLLLFLFPRSVRV